MKRDETAIFNPRGETSKAGLQTALSSRFTDTENQILKTVAMKIVYYITRGETQRLQTSVKFAARAKRGLQPHELHSLCFVSSNVIETRNK